MTHESPAPALLYAIATMFLASCGDDPCALTPAYGGAATDEVETTLKDARKNATTSGDAAQIQQPAQNAVYAAADGAPTFAWNSALKIALFTRPDPAAQGVVRRRETSWVDALTSVVIPSARAHEPPVTSDAYLVDIALPGESCPVSVVTTELSAQLDEKAWAMLTKQTASALTMTITSAYLEDGRITEGPYQSAAVKFSVTP